MFAAALSRPKSYASLEITYVSFEYLLDLQPFKCDYVLTAKAGQNRSL